MAVARRHDKRNLAVMFLDLDRFKFINDSLGHDAGDQLLKEVARRLRASVRETDTVARLGGDEFTVLLPEISGPQSAETVAAKILAATREPYRLADKELFVTSSIGISLYPADGEDAETLMKNADTAMYHIKEQGRAGYCFYTTELSARTVRRFQLESELHQALQRGEFQLHYQPQYDMETGKITGVEALVRWNHPRLGGIAPAEFLPLAEETGLIVALGEQVLATACRQAAQWRKEGRDVPTLSVNLSPRQFFHEGLADMVKRTLAASGLPAAVLELEIAESLAMQDIERTTAILSKLTKTGVKVAIADFGVGFHSAVNDLRRMPISAIKIARSFVRELGADPQNAAVMEGIISMSRNLGVKVFAIGVANREQLDRLRRMRCDHVQGHLLSRPLPAEEIAALLERAAPSPN